MGKARYKITDSQTGKVVMSWVTANQVAVQFEMDRSNVSHFAEYGYLIKRRYIVEKEEPDEFYEMFGIRAADYDRAMKEFREKMKGV